MRVDELVWCVTSDFTTDRSMKRQQQLGSIVHTHGAAYSYFSTLFCTCTQHMDVSGSNDNDKSKTTPRQKSIIMVKSD